jgi:hypothetical protein
MKGSHGNSEAAPVSEMTIVDTFTKLIFGEDSRYTAKELRIIQALRMVDTNVLFDSHRDMGAYLRALGVQEMIELVTRVQRQLASEKNPLPEVPPASSVRPSALHRRVH